MSRLASRLGPPYFSAPRSYVPGALDELVADPLYVTVLRSPITHVKSSFSYWGVASHIRNSALHRQRQRGMRIARAEDVGGSDALIAFAVLP